VARRFPGNRGNVKDAQNYSVFKVQNLLASRLKQAEKFILSLITSLPHNLLSLFLKKFQKFFQLSFCNLNRIRYCRFRADKTTPFYKNS